MENQSYQPPPHVLKIIHEVKQKNSSSFTGNYKYEELGQNNIKNFYQKSSVLQIKSTLNDYNNPYFGFCHKKNDNSQSNQSKMKQILQRNKSCAVKDYQLNTIAQNVQTKHFIHLNQKDEVRNNSIDNIKNQSKDTPVGNTPEYSYQLNKNDSQLVKNLIAQHKKLESQIKEPLNNRIPKYPKIHTESSKTNQINSNVHLSDIQTLEQPNSSNFLEQLKNEKKCYQKSQSKSVNKIANIKQNVIIMPNNFQVKYPRQYNFPSNIELSSNQQKIREINENNKRVINSFSNSQKETNSVKFGSQISQARTISSNQISEQQKDSCKNEQKIIIEQNIKIDNLIVQYNVPKQFNTTTNNLNNNYFVNIPQNNPIELRDILSPEQIMEQHKNKIYKYTDQKTQQSEQKQPEIKQFDLQRNTKVYDFEQDLKPEQKEYKPEYKSSLKQDFKLEVPIYKEYQQDYKQDYKFDYKFDYIQDNKLEFKYEQQDIKQDNKLDYKYKYEDKQDLDKELKYDFKNQDYADQKPNSFIQQFSSINQTIPTLKIEENKNFIKDIPQVQSIRNHNKFNKQRYNIVQVLGSGKFGKVYEVYDNVINQNIAMKQISKVTIYRYDLKEEVQNEISIMKQLNHQNIVQFIDNQEDLNYIFIMQELCNEGDLWKRLKRCQKLEELEVRSIIQQVLLGIQHMHERQIIHRDLKPENILFKDGKVKIGDFGTATFIKNTLRETFCGTLDYLSPEMIDNNPYDQSVDLWTIGVLTYELLAGKPPFVYQNEQSAYKVIKDLDYTFPEYFSQEAKDFISNLLKISPKDRLNIQSCLNHQFIMS